METVMIDTVVKDNAIEIPGRFNNRRVKIIIIDSEPGEREAESISTIPITRKLNYKIDETLEDVVPFADIEDSRGFVEKIRREHWS